MATTKLDRTSTAYDTVRRFLADGVDDPVQPHCRDADPDLFFPRSQVKALAQGAIEYCADCLLKKPCLQYAMAWDVDGIWAGTTKPERDRRRRRQHRRPIPVSVGILASTDAVRQLPAAPGVSWAS